ncbi:MAG: 5-formyltetrahydrofolate cyclo-ligase [Euryarchaeota archaeon]|nr:5-formyltetrahydrofolate cyclo-ligase [Euryarchaeota archaeon]
MRRLRDGLGAEEARAAALRLRDGLAEHPLMAGLDPGPVLLPTRHGTEIDTTPLGRALEKQGWTVCRPRTRIIPPGISAVPWTMDNPLLPGHAAVPEPPSDAPAVHPDDLLLALVPGLAFDATGHRVGYGAGYFDRFLEPLQETITIGVGYRFQLSATSVPAEAHDVRLDGLQLEDLSLVT